METERSVRASQIKEGVTSSMETPLSKNKQRLIVMSELASPQHPSKIKKPEMVAIESTHTHKE